jgi:NAD(P)-dependent dehydrogenase (short-subunit alcohol dehydrogenase family)
LINKIKQTVLLTGGLGLLGKAIAHDLNERGFHVIVVDIHDSAVELSENIDYIQFDLTRIDSYSELKEKVIKKTQNLKCLINNAAYNPKVEGEASAFGRFEEIQLESWQNELEINLTSPVFLIKEMLSVFNQADSLQCKIINMSSIYGVVPPNQEIYKTLSRARGREYIKPLSYSASKAALGMVTKYLAVYLGKNGFNVNGIVPGGIENSQPEEFVEDYSRLTPMGRMGKVDDFFEVVALLCGSGSDYMNGQLITVDGGWTVW